MLNKKNLITVIILFIISGKINATVSTGSLPISTIVSANCTLTSAVLNFGNYDPIHANISAPLNGTTTFQIACTKGSNAVISLNNGLNSSNAQGTTRAMSDGSGHYLSYELYSNSGRSNIWSNTNPVAYASTSSTAISEIIYGKIPAAQNSTAGNYIDTVTITATF